MPEKMISDIRTSHQIVLLIMFCSLYLSNCCRRTQAPMIPSRTSPSSPLSPLSQLPEIRWCPHLSSSFVTALDLFHPSPLCSVLRWGAAEREGGVWCLSAGWRRPDSLSPVSGMFPHTLPLSNVSQQKDEKILSFCLFVCFEKAWTGRYPSVWCHVVWHEHAAEKIFIDRYSLTLLLLEGDPSAHPAPGSGRALQRERLNPRLCRCVHIWIKVCDCVCVCMHVRVCA